MIRRFGEPAETGRRYTRRPGVYAILLRGDHILATHQAEPVPELQLPGGGIDRGEHPVPALHREVFEETGWKIAVTRRLGAFRRFTYMPEYDLWAEKLCAVYLAVPVRRHGPPSEAGHRAIWLPRHEAVARLGNPGDRAMLASLFGQQVEDQRRDVIGKGVASRLLRQIPHQRLEQRGPGQMR